MTERHDFEELLWSGDSARTEGDDSGLETQRRIHRLLRETVAQRPAPELSAGFEAGLSRRLRRHTARRRLHGWRRTAMNLYWFVLLVVVALGIGRLGPPLPAPTPLTFAIWSGLVLTSYLPLFFPRPFRIALRRVASPFLV